MLASARSRQLVVSNGYVTGRWLIDFLRLIEVIMRITFSENNKSFVLAAVAQSVKRLATRWTVRILLPALAQMVLCTAAFTWLIESDLSLVCCGSDTKVKVQLSMFT